MTIKGSKKSSRLSVRFIAYIFLLIYYVTMCLALVSHMRALLHLT